MKHNKPEMSSMKKNAISMVRRRIIFEERDMGMFDTARLSLVILLLFVQTGVSGGDRVGST
jgi:hypothetical protein